MPPELAGFQQSALARWRRELNGGINADDGAAESTTAGGPGPAGGGGGGDNGPKYVDIVTSIYGMREDLERIRKPVGTREHPVMTCKDLFYGHPQFKDGTVSARIANNGVSRISRCGLKCTNGLRGYKEFTLPNNIFLQTSRYRFHFKFSLFSFFL